MTHYQFKSASVVAALLFVSASAWAAPPHAPLPPTGDNARVLQSAANRNRIGITKIRTKRSPVEANGTRENSRG